jgi:hypothetical protein
MENSSLEKVKFAANFLGSRKDVTEIRIQERGTNHNHVQAVVKGADQEELRAIAESVRVQLIQKE